ncbi:hypothetical protein NIES2100_60090 [Calothrix sp. NIES-2100]|uniref:hypothetical protein n=1 Tax=Calothrix sp. NIES-2100 TaxID=1954172 RepID=UPI000B5F2423|nr:hypothetical protein NIES2100_60090 [Calothrix sp. NIES-2100]
MPLYRVTMRSHRLAIELHRLETQLHRPAIELHRLETQLHRPAIKLHRLETQLHRLETQLHRLAIELHRLETITKIAYQNNLNFKQQWEICICRGGVSPPFPRFPLTKLYIVRFNCA